MSFAKAFQRALNKQGQNMEVPEIIKTEPELVPHMYRAQIQPRCSLQFAGDRTHRDIWIEQWVYPKKDEDDGKPTYQYTEPEDVMEEGYFCRFKVEFPYRLFSNCGQDSIFRPMLGKNGIPFIPGSGIKGLFRRASDSKQAIKYCGDNKQLTPGILRFHGAYPVGDWASTVTRGEKTHYRLVDVVHPQEKRQVGIDEKSTSAFALISFYQPKLVFEISSTELLSQEEWKNISGKLRSALRQGLGGKTSTGYGLPFFTKNQYDIDLALHGVGITPVLLTGEPEFRPNVFKATLRSHAKRLLGGCCQNQQDDKRVERKIGELFGNTQAPGKVEIYWELRNPLPKTDWQPTYNIRGNLHISASNADVKFLKYLIKFAYTMGGFGKSWRRVWHKDFYHNNPHYDKLIGCHWKCEDSDWKNDISEWVNDIKTPENLIIFLTNLENLCKEYFRVEEPQYFNWREAWHKERVAVYSQIVDKSQVIELFHKEIYKQTQAIGGRKTVTKRKNGREERTEVLVVSSVWHRMLPIGDGKQYLEIVTVFHGDRTPWRNQLQPFINSLKNKGLQLSWGQEPHN
ncbi:RAMP superfamily CRISPR-associated protein [Scytonema sp. NUACC26]|uniref:RAMP superfamily CRISPR-associated protein n=1 Tax=Scytonema sp. NUACC26 TaxID=3140176 RepID=UPI0034DC96D6